MKKILIGMCVFAMTLCIAVPGWSVTGPWHYASPIDSILAYESLDTASDAEETAWADSIPGVDLTGLTFIKDESDGVKFTSLTLYDPDWPGSMLLSR